MAKNSLPKEIPDGRACVTPPAAVNPPTTHHRSFASWPFRSPASAGWDWSVLPPAGASLPRAGLGSSGSEAAAEIDLLWENNSVRKIV